MSPNDRWRNTLSHVSEINREVIAQQTRNVHAMLAHRLRRWPNIVPTLGKRLVFAWRTETGAANPRLFKIGK